MLLAACNPENKPNVAAVQTRGATVAFESIDGPPQAQFHTLVQDLNSAAQARQVAVTARDEPSAYRVRGYLAASVDQGKTTISWVWDVFDRNQHRALRISGSERAQAGDGWQAADGAMMQRIAQSSMGELASFLASPAVAPGTPDTSGPAVAFVTPDVSTPEGAGIFRIAKGDPSPASAAADVAEAAAPLPRRRPNPLTAVSAGETLTLAAANRR
ncbi:MAG TPA: hypothetical protein VE224_04355 [Pseudolabrys sp.]|nr:hypothetical protein [Pseudolabrys sp.]